MRLPLAAGRRRGACQRPSPLLAALLALPALLAVAGVEASVDARSVRAQDLDGLVTALGIDPRPPGSPLDALIVAARGDSLETWPPGERPDEPAGVLDLGERIVDVALDGSIAWVLCGTGQLWSVDVGDPTHPTLIASAAADVGGDPQFDPHFTHLIVPEPGILWRIGWHSGGTRGLPVAFIDAWDVRDPSAANQGATAWVGPGFGMLAADRGRALLAGEDFNFARRGDRQTNRLIAVDRANPLAPARGGHVEYRGWTRSVAVGGDRAWAILTNRFDLAPEGDVRLPDAVLAIDISDPEAPQALGWWPEPWDEIVALPGAALLRRGDAIALADLDDPLEPRVHAMRRLPIATGPNPAGYSELQPVIARSGAGAVARMANGSLAAIDPFAAGGPALHAPWSRWSQRAWLPWVGR